MILPFSHIESSCEEESFSDGAAVLFSSGLSMLIILHCNSGAHVWIDFGYLICSRNLCRSGAVTFRIFFKKPIFLYALSFQVIKYHVLIVK